MITLAQLRKMKQQGEMIACLTAYDATFAHWLNEAGVEVILVGDSLGMVVQGHATTLPVTLEEMVYHTQMVVRGNCQAWVIADLPFMSDFNPEQACQAAAQLMKAGGAHMVKLEGGRRAVPLVERLSSLGVPVCGHLGLLPQSVQKKGYHVTGRDQDSAQQLLDEAQALQRAGVDLLVLECVPADLAKSITQALEIPVIGIGSGAQTDGQVLVTPDLLGLTVGHTPKFSHNFLTDSGSIQQALANYVQAVKKGQFPRQEHEV